MNKSRGTTYSAIVTIIISTAICHQGATIDPSLLSFGEGAESKMFRGGNGVRGVRGMGCGVEFRLPDFDRRRSLIALCFSNIIWSSPPDLLSLQSILDGLKPKKGVLQLLLLSLFIVTKWNINLSGDTWRNGCVTTRYLTQRARKNTPDLLLCRNLFFCKSKIKSRFGAH